MIYEQRGITISGMLLWAALGIAVLLVAFKVGPAYFEYYTIQKQFKALATDPRLTTGNRREVEGAFVGRATIENIRSIGPSDLEVTKEGNGIVVSAAYSVRVPLFGNASACLDFYPSSAK
jgi:hypothetical protein